MTRLRVLINNASGENFSPSYDQESGILSVSSDNNRDWLFGCDVDGNIVFDLDGDCALANFDLHIPRRLWKQGEVFIPPIKKMRGKLVFSKKTIAQKSFSLPINVTHDSGKNSLKIEIGGEQANKVVALSGCCAAILHDDELVGFVINL